jgi:uncharacterized protein
MEKTLNPPHLKPLVLSDREALAEALWCFQPATSELSFTNLFMWREHYRTRWCRWDSWIVLLMEHPDHGLFAMEPVGPGDRVDIAQRLLAWLGQLGARHPRIERAGNALALALGARGGWVAAPTREHFDYVYRREDLVALGGKKYHAKRNHLNRFKGRYGYEYTPIGPGLAHECLDLASRWCEVNACAEDLSLSGELQGIAEALSHWSELALKGAAIRVEGRIQAITLGEKLNQDTVVIHVEKANPDYPELYTLINQQFLEHAWADVQWVNREQDLGDEGLRKAKLSYHPDHLQEKYRITLG